MSKQIEKLEVKFLFVSSITAFHLLFYPALVWLISELCYSHTFDYWQTFNFGLSAYFIETVIIYEFSFIAFTFWIQKNPSVQIEKENDNTNLISIVVTDTHHKKMLLQVNDVFYFSANSPYINIYHYTKKYLHTETLKSLEMQLDSKQFIRIHKSYIVNIDKVSAIQSRQNGDYDITLTDDTVLRVSRNYAKNFKSALEQHTQLTLK